jgi:hypothetical protein
MPTLGETRAVLRLVAIAAAVFLTARATSAGDWPQILGPTRNGHAAADERLPERLPADGPTVAWSRAVGDGYAGESSIAWKRRPASPSGNIARRPDMQVRSTAIRGPGRLR